jgi:hypothetical protein
MTGDTTDLVIVRKSLFSFDRAHVWTIRGRPKVELIWTGPRSLVVSYLPEDSRVERRSVYHWPTFGDLNITYQRQSPDTRRP